LRLETAGELTTMPMTSKGRIETTSTIE
jgi:hypothetical protein